MEENNDKVSEKSELPNNELSQKPKEGTAPLGNLENPWRYSSERRQRERQYMEYLKGKEIAESALCEYNNRHGTDLELVRFLEANHMDMFGPGCRLDFETGPAQWRHLNIEARRRSVDPDDENSLFLFVESICSPTETYDLLTLLLVAPTDKFNGCQKCWSVISHPRYGFRAGFTKIPPGRSPRCRPTASDFHESVEKISSVASDPKLLSEDDAVKLSQLALKDYNEKHGTNLKFERAFGCNSFTCAGRLMDFTEKSTRWVHVNFEAMVGMDGWESIRLMFAELYLGKDDKYVLATLLPAEPEDQEDRENPELTNWRDGYPASECAICPDEICHPWRGYRFCFNVPPLRLACEENNDETSEKSKLPNNERSQMRKKGTASLKGLLPGSGLYPPYHAKFINIPREENQDNSSEESSKEWKRRRPIFPEEEDQYEDYDTTKEIAESALCEYNNRHGTDLELVRLLEANHMDMFGPGCRLDFTNVRARWRHLNIEARRRSVDPDDENSLFLFVESICSSTNTYDLLTLLLVAPTDKFNDCQKCWSLIIHPRYGFRAGFTKNPPRRSPRFSDLHESAEKISDPKLLSQDDAVKLSQFALKDYNEKHGTNLKFVRAFGCNSFTCAGRLMDFTEKSTRWVHVNFEAMVGMDGWERIRFMFAELYLGNDDKYVLATLLPAEPEDRMALEEPSGLWRDGYPESECAICPDEICHPWRAYRYCFGIPPRRLACPMP